LSGDPAKEEASKARYLESLKANATPTPGGNGFANSNKGGNGFADGGMISSSHLSPEILQKAGMLSQGINPYQ
jgi:hypothetical protein